MSPAFEPYADLGDSCRRTLEAWAAPDADQARLRDAYLSHLDRHADGWSRRCPGAHLTASSLICSADGSRVLLVLHRRLGRWLQTGGHIEPGDASLPDAALREAREESGLPDLRLIPEIVQLDRHEVPCGPVRPAYHLDVRYVIVADPNGSPVVSDESDQARWFDRGGLPAVDESVRTLIAATGRLLER